MILPTERQQQLIRQLPLFQSLTSVQFAQLMAQTHCHSLKGGELLFQQGDPFKALFVTLEGDIKLFQLMANGDEKIVDIVSSGHTFAEAILFFRARRYPLNAIALKSTVVAAIPALLYEQILRSSVDLCFELMGKMSQRIHWLMGEIEQLTLHDATSRLINWLLDHATNAPNTTVELTLPKQVIASRLSIQPETLSRILKRLAQQGYLQLHENRIDLLNIEALRAHTQG
ncbi:Crp/Fnr family transcriptional regulator [Ectothiorhodospiraceae bacterium BW-2]|nr:Crp/Fnr family transcriptional regulator [Ectothiorhodospiraceae bacterium BW-2]